MHYLHLLQLAQYNKEKNTNATIHYLKKGTESYVRDKIMGSIPATLLKSFNPETLDLFIERA